MNAVAKAKRALTIACLEEMAADPQPLKVSMYQDGNTFDLHFTAEDVKAAATRQLERLRAQTKCDGFKATVTGDALHCTLEAGHDGQCINDAGQRWWRT